MLGRVIGTVGALIVYGLANMVYAPSATLVTGDAAGKQFENSDSGYLHATYVMNLFSGIGGLFTLLLALVIVAIWYRPVVKAIAKAMTAPLLALLALAASAPGAAAFFETVDKTEAYTILPNESAFWIPDVGANKDTQSQLESEAYLNANKVALKRFAVPHIKLSGSGGTAWYSGSDYYVPSGRLIIVDRTPFSREWVDAPERGTSKLKEGFPCQSKEGINITVGVALGASVTEQNAARYLYRFGVVAAKGARSDPQVIFTSVYFSRSVREVMDDFGRKKVSELICDLISVRGFDQANAEAKTIKDTASKAIVEFFATYGITIDFMGWADTFTFDKEVQDAVNRRYIASQDRVIAESLAPYTETIKALAAAQALREFGAKTDGRFPTTIVGLPPNIADLLNGLLQAPAKPAK